MRNPGAETLGEDQFEYFAKWYHAAIRELLFFYDYRGDFRILARKLNPPILPAEAEDAIRLLVRLGLVHKDASGRYRPLEKTLRKDASLKSLTASEYLKAHMGLGSAALERFPKDERHVSAMTLSFSEPFRAKALAEIEALRNTLLGMMDEDPEPDKVFQLNLQFFPLSR